jgi:hypothetical protein
MRQLTHIKKTEATKFMTLLFYLFSIASVAQPKITFEKTELNLDTIGYDSNGDFTFVFTNSGNEPLIISQCATSGGGLMCLNYPKEPIEPGKRGHITLHYDTHRIGSFRKSGYLTSNAQTPSVELTVTGYIPPIPIAFFKVTSHDFGFVKSRENLKWKFEIYNHGYEPLIILKVEPLDSCPINISKDTISSYQSSTIEICIDTKRIASSFEKKWKVFTNADSVPIELTASWKRRVLRK